MKNKNILNYMLAASIAIGASACKKGLDLNPISQATTTNSFNTADDAEAAITGVYNTFSSQDYYIWDNVYYGDVRSDNHYSGGDNQEFNQLDLLNISPTNSKVYGDWAALYNAILKANLVLQKVPAITDAKLTATRKNQIIGEAAFLRAFNYYQLVINWGGVPLVLTPISTTDPSETNTARASVTQVYDQIVSDLQTAVNNLPDTYGSDASVNKARATKGAANALLAKVWAQRPDRDYNKVLTYCDAVINSPAGYALVTNYSDLWDAAHYNSSESILEVQFNGTTISNWSPGLLLPPSITNTTWRKFITPSRDLAKAFDAQGDVVRKNQSILFENAPWADEYWSTKVGGSVPFSYKWRNFVNGNSISRQYLLRLADIILLKAEAQNALGRPAEAATTLNIVRKRAGLQNTTATTQADMALAVENERRLELTQEAQRWYDLVRYGRAETVMNNLVETNLVTGQRVNYNMTKEKELLPIPQTELNRNPALKQNPGY
ncbi:RagB/SusD family nutrient uptake outer membrane protein [Mucilaginibacter sp. RS28]|uniref:RagB/SusD family nutrient uptake outer membrane protein n=1 Tax=Mucilaginibacter straminoryzae TaxID=2932774 RepID=A0A9X1X3F9_9SPHI|nr:RagB/SusD family nutrient uptake outer membrane protein [Mucilaginibacter straminoryzae]MCJ8208948.1 RagB/SusD family nutrient uptake outer membrane protein [Mucilaginibacter straminoryzae]